MLDADIYGPSMPKLFALSAKPSVIGGRTLVPLDGYGCKVMSIGFVVEEDKALVWRGPMVHGRDHADAARRRLGRARRAGRRHAARHRRRAAHAGPEAPLAGAVIVSTPQDLALIDARRGVAMFREVGVPILGLIENMSYFVCDECGKRHEIFAHGGARAEAARLGVPLLGEIPLDPMIRERSDAGLPIVVTEPDSPHAKVYVDIARQIGRASAPAGQTHERGHAFGTALAAALFCAGAAHAQSSAVVQYDIVGQSISASFTSTPGNPDRGRAITADPDRGNCSICHLLPAADPRQHGDLAPPLAGAGSRLTSGELRLRIVDATPSTPTR